jgi:hypothetical protein
MVRFAFDEIDVKLSQSSVSHDLTLRLYNSINACSNHRANKNLRMKERLIASLCMTATSSVRRIPNRLVELQGRRRKSNFTPLNKLEVTQNDPRRNDPGLILKFLTFD